MVPREHSTYISVIGDNNSTLMAHTVGDATLVLKERKHAHKELIYLPVSVSFTKTILQFLCYAEKIII